MRPSSLAMKPSLPLGRPAIVWRHKQERTQGCALGQVLSDPSVPVLARCGFASVAWARPGGGSAGATKTPGTRPGGLAARLADFDRKADLRGVGRAITRPRGGCARG